MCLKYCLTFKYLASYCNTLVPSYKLSHVCTKLQSMHNMWLNISSSINKMGLKFHCMTYHCVYLSSSLWAVIKSCTFNGGLKPNSSARFQRSTRNKPTHTCIICCTIWISYTYNLLVLVHTGDNIEQVTWIITERTVWHNIAAASTVAAEATAMRRQWWHQLCWVCAWMLPRTIINIHKY